PVVTTGARCFLLRRGAVARSARATESRGEDELALVLGEAAPHAVGLAHLEGVLAALLDDGALGTDRLGGFVASPAGATALTLGVEEEVRVGLAALALVLPLPEIHDRSGKPRELCHVRAPFQAGCDVGAAGRMR